MMIIKRQQQRSKTALAIPRARKTEQHSPSSSFKRVCCDDVVYVSLSPLNGFQVLSLKHIITQVDENRPIIRLPTSFPHPPTHAAVIVSCARCAPLCIYLCMCYSPEEGNGDVVPAQARPKLEHHRHTVWRILFEQYYCPED